MAKDDYFISEVTDNIEDKYLVKEVIEVDKGWHVWFKRDGNLCCAQMPHGYTKLRAKHPGFWKGFVFGKYCWIIGKRRESPNVVGMYGEAVEFPMDEWQELARNGLYAKGMRDLRSVGSVPKWLIIGGLLIALLVGGVCVTKEMSKSDSKETTGDINENGIPDYMEDFNNNGIPDYMELKDIPEN